MAHALGIDVVAEGVETAEPIERLRTMNGEAHEAPARDRVQGFLLGRPVPARDAEAWVFGDPPRGQSRADEEARAVSPGARGW